MKIYIVAPYKAMETSLKKIRNKYDNITIDYGVGDIYDGLNLAKKAESNGFDVIISRGGTAKLIKKHMNTPLVDMKLSGNDILKAILLANNGHNTAIIAYSNITNGAKEIIELLNLDMKIYTITDQTDLTKLLIKLKKENVVQILGDIVAINKADGLMFETILFQSGYETIKIAIDYAISMFSQISKRDMVNVISSKFFEKNIEDYCILKGDKIFQSKYTNYEKMPISYESLIGLKYKYNNKLAKKTYIEYSDKLQIVLNKINYDIDDYYLFEFKRKEDNKTLIRGVKYYKPKTIYKMVNNSYEMNKKLKKLSKLIDDKIIVFCSEDQFTIDNFLNYLDKSPSLNGNLLIVDLNIYSIDKINNLNSLDADRYIFKNVGNESNLDKIKDFSYKFNNKVLIITDNINWIQDEDCISNTIFLPTTKERKDDIVNIFNFYIGYYHNNAGTKPLKLKEDFLKDFDKYSIETIYNLLKVLNSLIKGSKELLISSEEFLKKYKNIGKNDSINSLKNLTLEQVEHKMIKLHLENEEYNQTKAAEKLGISRATLWRKMKKYNF